MKRKILIPLTILVVIIAAIAIYFTQKPKEPETIKIGAILPLTGNNAWFGEHARNSLILLEEEINSQNKLLEIVIYDSKSDPKEGLNAYRKMILDKITRCYVGLDPVAKTIVPNIEKDNVVMFVGSVDNDIAKMSKNLFRLYYGFRNESVAESEFLIKKGVKSVSMLLRDVGVIKKYKEEFLGNNLKQNGITTKRIEYFDPTTKDFRTLLTKILTDRPDAIVMSEYGVFYPTIFKHLRSLTSSPPLILGGLGMLNVKEEDFPLYEGVIFTAPAYFFISDSISDFRNKYIKRFGIPPTYEAYYAYDAVKTLYLAIRNSDGTTEGIRKYILENQFKGVSQPVIKFDKDGDLDVSVVFKTFKGGKIVDYKFK
jgi:branched-chain amino acid transport system substrate-binding protein